VILLGVVAGCLGWSPAAAAEAPPPRQVADLLRDEPITAQTWPAWKRRLLDWMSDDALRHNAAFEAARSFVKSQRFGNRLRKPLEKDPLAHYLLGNGYLREAEKAGNAADLLNQAQRSLRQSLQANRNFARAHRDLGLALMRKYPHDPSKPLSWQEGKDLKDARKELAQARQQDPSLLPTLIRDEARLACRVKEYEKTGTLQALVQRFPRDGGLACYLAAALWHEKKVMPAGQELRRARQLGTDPAAVLGPALVRDIDAASPAVLAKQAGAVATPEEVQQLKRTPLTLTSWPSWSSRFQLWRKNPTAPTNAEALHLASEFLRAQAKNGKDLPRELGQDPVALYVLGLTYLRQSRQGNDRPVQHRLAELAEHQFYWAIQQVSRRSVNDALAHLRYADALLRKDQTSPRGDEGALRKARDEMAEARRLDPSLKPDRKLEARIAVRLKDWNRGEELYRQLLDDNPAPKEAAYFANEIAFCILNNGSYQGRRAARLRPLVAKFPDNGRIASWNGLFLGLEGDVKGGAREFERARSLGTDPTTVVHPQNVKQIEDAATPSLLERWFWMTVYFFLFYGIVMGLMALGGLLLARMNRGRRALQLLGEKPKELVGQGQVVRTSHESSLTRLYAFALITGLLLFYVSIPFVIIGLVVFTLFGVLLLFFLSRSYEGSKMAGDIMKASGGGTWSVLKCLFARFSTGSFGIHKTEQDCPRLYQLLADVARRVDTDPVTDVYVAPGNDMSVHQEGRGPFGIFGVKRRVLTLGLPALYFLTVSEFRSILAHEYAHFSHSDTFYSRFIYQVSLSIRRALNGMAQTGGWVTWINPFYWFYFLYNKAYAMLSAGYSRSREFLADRMACSLYGSNTFASALTKVCTDGTLFELTIYDKINEMLDKKKAFVNMYAAFRDFRDKAFDTTEREKLYQKLLDEKESLFASHPTFAERIDAAAPLPRALKTNNHSALEVFEDPEAIERELTDFLTEVMNEARRR
jgi:Zn-dependent protease with chaperone function